MVGRRGVAIILLAVTALAACGRAGAAKSSPASTSPVPASTSTTLAPTAFADAVRTRDLNALKATFADDIKLYSPVLADPFVGRARVNRLFDVLVNIFKDIHITNELQAPHQYALSFDTHAGTEPLRIVDLLTFDDTGRITTFVVTARPLPGIQALAAAVAPHLPQINGS